MVGEAGAVVVSATGPITVPAEEDDNEDELIVETTAGSVAKESADATNEIDELVDAAEVVNDPDEEVEDDESLAFLLALFFDSFFSLSMGSVISFLDRLLLSPEEVNALSSVFIVALEASISSNNFNNVTEKSGISTTIGSPVRREGEGSLIGGFW